jgi:hypothetical protein
MALLMSTWPSSRPIWSPIHVFTSPSWPMLLSSRLQRLSMRPTQCKRSLCRALSPTTRWSNAIHATANTWQLACCIAEMLFPTMCTQQLPLSRPSEPFNLWIGALLDSRLVSASNPLRWCQMAISPRSTVQCKFRRHQRDEFKLTLIVVCFRTPQPSLKPGPHCLTSST